MFILNLLWCVINLIVSKEKTTCKHFIRTVPNLVYDEKDVEDIDTDGEDHIYDMARYVLMENPIAPRLKPVPVIKPYDPLSVDNSTADRYAFYRKY